MFRVRTNAASFITNLKQDKCKRWIQNKMNNFSEFNLSSSRGLVEPGYHSVGSKFVKDFFSENLLRSRKGKDELLYRTFIENFASPPKWANGVKARTTFGLVLKCFFCSFFVRR